MKLNNTSKELKGSYECAKHVLYYLYIRKSFLLVGNSPFHPKLIAFDSWLLLLDVELVDFVEIPLEKAGRMIILKDVYCLFKCARATLFFFNLGVFLSL